MKTHQQATKAAMRSLFRLLEKIEQEPENARELVVLRHLSAFRIPGDTEPEPIEHTTLVCALQPPHPLFYVDGNKGDLVGDFDLYDHFRDTLEPVAGWAGYRVRKDGSTEFVPPGCHRVPGTVVIEPLGFDMVREDIDALGILWHLEDYSEHCDADMPADARERIAAALEKGGLESDETPKGEAGCRTTGMVFRHGERWIPGDKLANTRDLRWAPAPLAHMVRELGLRIDPKILKRFGVDENGHRPAIVYSSHSA